jgi:WD40 repeat protein
MLLLLLSPLLPRASETRETHETHETHERQTREGLRHTRRADCVSYVAWSLDDKWLLSGGNDLAVNLWDAASGLLLRQFVRHTEPVTAMAWWTYMTWHS